jgi:hypothetical protein
MNGVVDEWIMRGVELLQAYGWYVVFSLVAFYFAQPAISEMQSRMSLSQAQAPSRVRVLDEDRQRVRLRQQLEHLTKKSKLGGDEVKDD